MQAAEKARLAAAARLHVARQRLAAAMEHAPQGPEVACGHGCRGDLDVAGLADEVAGLRQLFLRHGQAAADACAELVAAVRDEDEGESEDEGEGARGAAAAAEDRLGAP